MSGDTSEVDNKNVGRIFFMLIVIGLPFSVTFFWGLYAHLEVGIAGALFGISFAFILVIVYMIFKVSGTKASKWIGPLVIAACGSGGVTCGSALLVAILLAK